MRLRITAVLTFAALIAAGCFGDHVLPERTTTEIDTDGGEAVSPDGTATLQFPEGAVDGPVAITVEIVRGVTLDGQSSELYDLGPSGTTFAVPVTLSIDVAAGAEGRLRIGKVVDGAAVEVAGSTYDADAGQVVAELSSFSRYGVFDFHEKDWDPCGGKSCGAECHLCAPDDPDCVETTVVKYCQADGSCDAHMPECAGADCHGPNPAKGCSATGCDDGEACAYSDDACAPSYCDCDDGHWICTEDCGPGWMCIDEADVYDPCEGKACGETCQQCPPWDHDCVETTEVKACDTNGACTSWGDHDSCDADSDYDPCGGKQCGEVCTLCDPHDHDCAETTVIKYCDDHGVCEAMHPHC